MASIPSTPEPEFELQTPIITQQILPIQPMLIELEDPKITMRRFPPLSHTFQNIFTSLFAICAALCSLVFTIFCILPLSVFRSFRPKEDLSLAVTSTPEAHHFFGAHDELKTVLIVGASRLVGFELIKLYSVEKTTKVVAVCPGADLPALRAKVSDLGGSAQAMFRFEALDLSDPDGIADAVRHFDTKFGPLSHLFVVCGIPAHLKEHPDAWKLVPTVEMVQRNIIGTVAAVLTALECMGERRYGKIAVVSSGYTTPVNMLSHVGIKAFFNSYLSHLRVVGNIVNVDVVNISVEHKFSDGLLEYHEPLSTGTGKLDKEKEKEGEESGSELETPAVKVPVSSAERGMLEDLAKAIWDGVEGGGIATVGWPTEKYMMVTAGSATNPLVQQFKRWAHARQGK